MLVNLGVGFAIAGVSLLLAAETAFWLKFLATQRSSQRYTRTALWIGSTGLAMVVFGMVVS